MARETVKQYLPKRHRRSRARVGFSRGRVLLLAILLIFGLGLLIRELPGDWTLTTADKRSPNPLGQTVARAQATPVEPALFDPRQWSQAVDTNRRAGESGKTAQQIRVLFEHGANLLRQGHYRQARQVLAALVELAPGSPEAHVNLAFALFELDQIKPALKAFARASQLNPYQSNAYYGAALAYEQLRDYEAAVGQMRSFIHLSQADNRFLPKARAALWEWQRIIALRHQ